MPRDKSLSHIRVNKAIMEEFLEKGYEAASIRSIGARAGMTSAGLYRHYADKEAMFEGMVSPLVDEMKSWLKNHTSKKYDLVDSNPTGEQLFGESFIDLIRNVILPRRQEFILLMTCSAGTKYENFIHDLTNENQKEFLDALKFLKKKGYKVKTVSEEELHFLLSAYLTACFEPIIHDYNEKQIDKYLNLIQEFFMPGWLRIMGIE
ncbi:MAG: TetR/AcrR family transcriptional regulator [Lachnospiraceae bacterium]|nr:TetR/AcrR family transcriptional regulator [Lachnospiraceae bacterium]